MKKCSPLGLSKVCFAIADNQIQNELESVRLRLELEAETQIEQAVKLFREKLKIAAQEEIEYILKHTQDEKNA